MNEVNAYMYCQLLYCLSKQTINIFGSTVKNWIIPCYYSNTNPCNFQNILKSDYEYIIYRDIDIWIDTDKHEYKQLVEDISQMTKSLGYTVTIIKQSYIDFIHIQVLRLTSDITQSVFHLHLYGTNKFLNVDFDINNLYISCSPFGFTEIKLLTDEYLHNQIAMNEFGYLYMYNYTIQQTIRNILNKECNILDLDTSHYINKVQYFDRLEKVLDSGYKILNHSAIESEQKQFLPDDRCSICLEELIIEKSILQIRCQHIFHKSCIFTWWRKKKTMECPNCREFFSF